MQNAVSISLTFFLLIFSSLAVAERQKPEEIATDHLSYLLEGVTTQEFKDARKYFFFKDGGRDLLAVHINLGYIGGNGRQYYLAVFEKECNYGPSAPGKNDLVCIGEPRYRLRASELLGEVSDLAEKLRQVDMSFLQFEKGTFKVKVFNYKPEDATCCPSEEKIVNYILESRSLLEI